METIERTGHDDEEEEGEDEYWLSKGKTPPSKTLPLYKHLGVGVEWLLANFGGVLFPER